jgi:hypothetical protein
MALEREAVAARKPEAAPVTPLDPSPSSHNKFLLLWKKGERRGKCKLDVPRIRVHRLLYSPLPCIPIACAFPYPISTIISLCTYVPLFRLSMAEIARELGVCTSAIAKVVQRWGVEDKKSKFSTTSPLFRPLSLVGQL